MAAASLTLLSSASHAATAPDDGFGGSTFFTAQTPDALGDTPTGTALATKTEEDNAESVSKIEPAAGGENYGVFTLPEDPAVTATGHSGEILNSPSQPIVPGQTVNKETK